MNEREQSYIDKDNHFVDPSLPHLGGNTAGGNPATFFPELWKWMVARLEIESVFDVGCGEGHAMREFERLGCSVYGLDGLPRNAELAKAACVDLTETCPVGVSADLIWCCEVVGQIEEKYVRNIASVFRGGKYVALTHQLPNQAGYHIVNGQLPEYWQGVLACAGFVEDVALTDESKNYGKTYWSSTGTIFRRIK